MDCKNFHQELPDLVLTAGARPSLAAVAHMKVCPPCADEYRSFQQTFGLLDAWKPVEPSPYFDQKLAVRVRELQAEPPMSWLQRLQTRLELNTGRHFRPAMAAALSLALVAGAGSYAGVNAFHAAQPQQASATINDLQILDRNEQAFQAMDAVQQDDNDDGQPDDAQQSTPST